MNPCLNTFFFTVSKIISHSHFSTMPLQPPVTLVYTALFHPFKRDYDGYNQIQCNSECLFMSNSNINLNIKETELVHNFLLHQSPSSLSEYCMKYWCKRSVLKWTGMEEEWWFQSLDWSVWCFYGSIKWHLTLQATDRKIKTNHNQDMMIDDELFSPPLTSVFSSQNGSRNIKKKTTQAKKQSPSDSSLLCYSKDTHCCFATGLTMTNKQ